MREYFAIIFVVLIVLLALCGTISRRSTKTVAKSVAWLEFVTIAPVFGNMIVVLSTNEFLSTIGIYITFLGFDAIVLALFIFTHSYCNIAFRKNWVRNLLWGAFLLDFLQLAINPFLHHAFSIEQTIVNNSAYYKFEPHWGITYHYIISYGLLLVCIITFLVKTIRVPKVYSEKYYVILCTMFVAGIWQAVYTIFKFPINTSMIGLTIFAILVFYFSLFFRPLKLLDRMLANVASIMPESIFFFDTSDRCVWVNSNGRRLLRVSSDNLESVLTRLAAMFDDLGEDKDNWVSKQKIGSGDEAQYYTLERHLVTDSKSRKIGSFLSVRDNTEDARRHRRDVYIATHDKLTDLYTKEYLYELIHANVTKNRDMQYWLAYIDIKDFKLINDIFGNNAGDEVLKSIANWIRSNAAPSWIYGRIAGDAFGICFQATAPHVDLIEHQLSKFTLSSSVAEQKLLMHVGLYKITDPDIDVSIMFDRAHLALTTIKNEYNTHVAVYDDNMRNQVLWNNNISSQLEHALNKKEICPYMQPIVNPSGKIIGAEALVRWIHPEEGFLAPFKFIPVFEKNGMIPIIDKFIWRSACEILASWKLQPDKKDLFISVNISPKDFYFMDVFSEINSLTEEYAINPRQLRIEITETVMMNEVENRLIILNKFRKAGFLIEMDDFGSGYSSLNQLKDMPIDVLKIDMKFLSKAQDENKSNTILRNVLRLSNDLGLLSLTEGVETESQYKMLLDMGCHLFQGYYFAKPMPLKDFEAICSKS